MRRKILAALSVWSMSLLFLLLFRPVLDPVDLSIRDWLITWHAKTHQWPPDLVTVPLTLDAIQSLSKDQGGQLRREDAAVIWDRLRQLGVRTILFDGALVASRDTETDERVSRSLERTFLPVIAVQEPVANAEILKAHSIALSAAGEAIEGFNLKPPIEPFASRAAGLGHVVQLPDRDGHARSQHPILRLPSAPDRGLPSLPLRALLHQRGISLEAVRWTPSRLEVPGLPSIPLHGGRMMLELSRKTGPPPQIDVGLLLDVSREEESRRAVEGKLALIYLHTLGNDRKPSALGVETPGGLLLAHAVRTLSTGDTQRQVRRWQLFLPLLALLTACAPFLVSYTPRSIAAITAGALAIYAALQFQFLQRHLLLPLVLPSFLIAGTGVSVALQAMWRMRDEILLARKRADAGTAPTGRIALVFTDVQGSTALWEAIPDAMREALAVHNALLRATLSEANGYEVKTEGDAFMIAFRDPLSAAAFCLATQERLLEAAWPAALLASHDAREERGPEGNLLYRGLRVRMGIHVGEPEPRVDPLTARMDYFGPHVNRAARVSGAAHGGQIVISGDAQAAIAAKRSVLPDHDVIDLGSHFLKGLLSAEHLYELRLVSVRGRSFPPVKAGDGPTGKHHILPG